MNLEFEVKTILREYGTPESKADKICSFATFKRENVISCIKKGGMSISEVYGNIIRMERKC